MITQFSPPEVNLGKVKKIDTTFYRSTLNLSEIKGPLFVTYLYRISCILRQNQSPSPFIPDTLWTNCILKFLEIYGCFTGELCCWWIIRRKTALKVQTNANAAPLNIIPNFSDGVVLPYIISVERRYFAHFPYPEDRRKSMVF